MFAASTALFVFSLLSLTSATPLSFRRQIEQALSARDSYSFNNWNNISQLSDFDNFYGSNNFNGGSNSQTVITEVSKQCETVDIEFVQQKLVILQEIAKRIITEQICDVQVQTIVIEQHRGSIEVFRKDVSRQTTRQVGYDQSIASKITQIVNSDGSLSTGDNGFSGSSVGGNLVVPSGNNWDNSTGPARVQSALSAVHSAISSSSNSSSPSSTSSSSSATSSSSASQATSTSTQ